MTSSFARPEPRRVGNEKSWHPDFARLQSPHKRGPMSFIARYRPRHNAERLVANSTTHWILELQAGNRQAAEELWQRYYLRLVGYARRRLYRRRSKAHADENDVALSAFASFYRAAEGGRFPELSSSNDLWRLLIVITQRKINRCIRYDMTQKRIVEKNSPSLDVGEIADNEPTPEFVVTAIDSFESLLSGLRDPNLCSIALMKMEGYTNEEIASRLKCSLSTVERKLRRIRHEWSATMDSPGESNS